jgi:hypothetical protein
MVKKYSDKLFEEEFCFGDEDCKAKKRKSGACKTGGKESGRNRKNFMFN